MSDSAGQDGAADIVAIIPARLGSTRFPRKVLADKTGSPLIRHVYEAVERAAVARDVVVATDSTEVASAVEGFGGRAVMTGDHPNGTSRLAEAAHILGLDERTVVLNVQGDEPEVEPAVLEAAVRALDAGNARARSIGSVAVPIGGAEDPADPNIVKVVVSAAGDALYFSRAPVPHDPEGRGSVRPLRHIGVYAYRRSFLRAYVGLEPGRLELCERLEQLRALEHGHTIGIELVEDAHSRPGIDTPEQYERFVDYFGGRPRDG